jgi:hypothetical protein
MEVPAGQERTWTPRTSVQLKMNSSRFMMKMKNLDNYLVVLLLYPNSLLKTNTKSLLPTKKEVAYKVLLRKVALRVASLPKRTQ